MTLPACRLSLADAERELAAFKVWLDDHDDFGEAQAVAELRARPNLCLLIHQAAGGAGLPDCMQWEVALRGVFRADLVIGSTATRPHFVMVEFEDGRRNSLFKRKRDSAQLTEWSPRVEHAFSQVSDWTWAKSHRDPLYHNIFGVQQMSETYLIVCGRERFLTDPLERERLAWRDDKTSVSSCKINFWTYDDLYTYTNALMVTFQAALGLRP